jgi:hypothetical protein
MGRPLGSRNKPKLTSTPATKPTKSSADLAAIRQRKIAALAKARAVRAANRAARLGQDAQVAHAQSSAKLAPVVQPTADSTTGQPPYLIDPNWRIVARDKRNWELQQRRNSELVIGEDGEDANEEGVELGTTAGESWGAVGWYSTIGGLLTSWGQRYARTSTQPIPVALAQAAQRLEQVLVDLRAATAGL